MRLRAYSTTFYKDLKEGSRRSAEEVLPLVLELVQPKSVIDVGCGTGTWLAVLKKHGIENICGIDSGEVDEASLEIPKDQFLRFDLRKPLQLSRQFDLVLSLEVAEHLPPECAATFVDSLTSLGPVVVFSAAIPFQGGTHHRNEQWPDYWVQLFRNRGFVVIDCLRKRIWSNSQVEWWYAQNTLLFARRDYLERNPLLKREFDSASSSQLLLVHPKCYLAAADPQRQPLRKIVSALPLALINAIKRRTTRRPEK